MTTTSTAEYQPSNFRQLGGGGRIASDAYRNSLALSGDFAGLEDQANRYDLLLLVKKVGKAAGFTPRMVALLDYYLAYSADCDWEQGSRPIVFQSVARTALDLGVSERQIQKLESQLFAVGAITWNDSGNHKRYGRRDAETGRLVYAYGVDLTPLAYLRDELEQKLQEKKLYDDAWMATKREISWHRRQIRAMLLEIERKEGIQPTREHQRRYTDIAIQLRTHLSLETLRSLLERHISLQSDLEARATGGSPVSTNSAQRASVPEETGKRTCRSEPEFAHYKYTTHPSNSCSRADPASQKSVAEPTAQEASPPSSGAEHVSLPMATGAASERFRALLPTDPTWSDVVDAAYALRPTLGVSQASWAGACQLLGRTGAALCLLVTDRATERAGDPVRRPAAYFRGMIRRAETGELRLHNSLFGLLR